MKTLDSLFWKWASICSRISAGKEIKKLVPPKDASNIWFSKTQLNQAMTDVRDIRTALKQSIEQKKRNIKRLEKRAKEIKEAINEESKRDINPKRPSNFRIKLWVETTGNLKQKFHTINYWKRGLKDTKKLIEKRKKTLEKIERGRICFKPKRITLHQNEYSLNFGASKLLLNPFYRISRPESTHPPMELTLLCKPLQPIRGSSKKSSEFLKTGILNFLTYTFHARLFGLNRSLTMLLKAKKPEKVSKKQKALKRKRGSFGKSIKNIEKMINRTLSKSERNVFEKEHEIFFSDISNYTPSNKYIATLNKLAIELHASDRYFKPFKYPILIRKPINKYKTKKISRLKPEEYEYFFQISYEPFPKPKIKCKRVMGIDRGIKHLLAVSVFDPSTKRFTYNKLIKNPIFGWKRKLRKLRRSIQKLERKKRATTGEHIHENQLKKRFKSVKNKVENLYHNVSADIVEIAKENKAVIVFENLERQGLKQHARSKGKKLKNLNYFLSNFDYAKIASLIKYKSDKEGISVFDILPAYTSQTCAKCLIENKDHTKIDDLYTRQKNSKIGICKKHGEIDADLNAARTIAICYARKLNDPQPFGTRKRFK